MFDGKAVVREQEQLTHVNGLVHRRALHNFKIIETERVFVSTQI